MLSKHELNGRQIRNIIRLSTAKAKAENTSLGMRHLEKTIDITKQFTHSYLHDARYTLTAIPLAALGAAVLFSAWRYLK